MMIYHSERENENITFSCLKKMKNASFLFFLCLFFYTSCSDYAPKPSGYFRIELNEPEYEIYTDPAIHILFNVQKLTRMEAVADTTDDKWFNIVYPALNAKIFCSFLPVKSRDDLIKISEDSHKFVYKHTIKSDGISTRPYSDPDNQVYALIYDIEGNVASPLQFVITDSTRYFFRGSLYFDSTPNQDSIAPVKSYILNDIHEIIRSFRYQ